VIPAFGYKNHFSTDRQGLISEWTMSSAPAHDGTWLPELLNKTNAASNVCAVTACRSKKNEAYEEKNGFVFRVHRKKPKSTRRAIAEKSEVQTGVEHVFAAQKHRMGLSTRASSTRPPVPKSGFVEVFRFVVARSPQLQPAFAGIA